MYKNLLSRLTVLFALSSCSGPSPTISVVCEENNVGNCIIKWETAPAMKGQVKVYSSTSPDNIPEESPVGMADIASGKLTIVTKDPTRRHYYLMVFGHRHRVKVATRNVNIPGIQNFRDLGGYPSFETGKVMRWGMIYRSAQIDSIPSGSCRELHNMGIRTIVDLRLDRERLNRPPLRNAGFNQVHIPLLTPDIEQILQGIRENKIATDTVYRMVEHLHRAIVRDNRQEFKQLFTLLLNPDNYPMVIHCTSGNRRTGIVSALLLAALGVNEDIIMHDYRLSNDYFNIPRASKYAYHLPANLQEAITTIYSAKKDFLNAGMKEIQAEYGSTQNYLTQGIGLAPDEIEQLRKLLLTDPGQ